MGSSECAMRERGFREEGGVLDGEIVEGVKKENYGVGEAKRSRETREMGVRRKGIMCMKMEQARKVGNGGGSKGDAKRTRGSENVEGKREQRESMRQWINGLGKWNEE